MNDRHPQGRRATTGTERGQVLILVAMLLLGLVAVIGLATDGGIVFAHRRDLQNLADGAALAGAMQVDGEAYRGEGTVRLDPPAARRAAEAYLSGTDVTAEVTAATDGVEVQVQRRAETGFLRLIGIDGVTISARALAAPRGGGAAAPAP